MSSERHDHPTYARGAYSIAIWLNGQSNETTREAATRVIIREHTEDGTLLMQTIAVLDAFR